MLIALAKLGTPETVGVFALGLAVTGPVIMFTNLQLRGVQVTDAKREYQFGHYLGLRLLSLAVALVVIGTLAFESGYSFETAIVIFVIGVTKTFDSLSDIIYGLLQQREYMSRIAISYILQGIFQLGALGMALLWTHRLLFAVLAMAVTSGLITLFYDIPNAAAVLNADQTPVSSGKLARFQSLRPRWSWKILSKLAWLSLPLGLVMLLVSLNVNIPRYFIEHQLGAYQLGIFAAIASLPMINSQVINALGQAASPRLSQYYANGDVQAFQSTLMKLVVIGAVFGGFMLLPSLFFGRQALTALFGVEYARFFTVFLWIMIGAWLFGIGQFLGYGMTAARRFKQQAPLFLVIGISTLLSCWWLIPKYELLGATYALVIGALIQLVGSAWVILLAIKNLSQKEQISSI